MCMYFVLGLPPHISYLGGGAHFSSIVETTLKAAENHNLWGRRVLSNVPQNGGFL
jgi:hypothetical protein